MRSKRAIRFEIEAEREGRWTTESISADETEAVEIARRLLDAKGTDAVRVIREHESGGHIVSAEPVFEERRQIADADKRLSSCDDDGAWCETLDDLYGDRSRRTMGQLLRAFLDAMGVTPTEILHSYRVFKRLDNADGLLTAALGRIARARAASTGADAAATLKALEKIVREATMRVRDAAAARLVPTIDAGGLDKLWEKFRKGCSEGHEQHFQFRHSLCRTLEGCNGLPARLETVLGWSAAAKAPQSIAVIDELVADCLGSAATIKDMLGPQPDLATALGLTIDLARGRLKSVPAKAPAWFATLRQLLDDRPAGASRQVLMARVKRELMGDRPLSREGMAGEGKALGVIAERLYCDKEGVYLGGAEMVAALARRWSRLDRPGGFGDLPAPTAKPPQAIKTLLDYEREAFGEARKRAVATAILSTVRAVPPAGRGDLAAVGALVAGSGLSETARRTIAAELAAR